VFALVLAMTIAAPAAAPPDGTYTYEELEGDKAVARYVVSVKRSGATIDVTGALKPEVLRRGGISTIDSHAALDAATLDLLSYHETEALGCDAMPFDVTVSGSRARLGDRSVAFPGIAHFVLDDGHSVPFFLPAEVAVWSDGRAVSLAPEVGAAHVIEPYPMARQPARPATVPSTDRYIAVHALGAKTGSSGLWYDPQTLVVDEVDTATNRWLRKDHL
jgi:hypothetical protein